MNPSLLRWFFAFALLCLCIGCYYKQPIALPDFAGGLKAHVYGDSYGDLSIDPTSPDFKQGVVFVRHASGWTSDVAELDEAKVAELCGPQEVRGLVDKDRPSYLERGSLGDGTSFKFENGKPFSVFMGKGSREWRLGPTADGPFIETVCAKGEFHRLFGEPIRIRYETIGGP